MTCRRRLARLASIPAGHILQRHPDPAACFARTLEEGWGAAAFPDLLAPWLAGLAAEAWG